MRVATNAYRETAEPVDTGRASEPPTLSEREVACVRLLTAGLADKEISAELDISIRTVRFHILNIKRVLKVRTRAHLVARALHDGIVQELKNEMAEDTAQALGYRDRAEELRTLAEEREDERSHDVLLDLARCYEAIADQLESIDRKKRSLSLFER